MKKFNPWWFLLLVPFVLGLAVALSGNAFYELEKSVCTALRVLEPAMDIPFIAITELGSAVGVIAITAIIFIVTAIKKKHFFTVGLPIAVVAIVSRLINVVIKELVNRPRPDFKAEIYKDITEASFPSGHAQNNMALYVAILVVFLLVVTAPKWRMAIKITTIALPLLIGITRIYFGVHFVSDVVAGWGMGAFVALLTLFVYFRIYDKVKEKRNAKA